MYAHFRKYGIGEAWFLFSMLAVAAFALSLWQQQMNAPKLRIPERTAPTIHDSYPHKPPDR
jgi:hypothetical protein